MAKRAAYELKRAGLAAICSAVACLCHSADLGDISATVGVKEWLTDWTTWRVNNVFFDTGRIQINEILNSSSRLTTTPQVSLRYEKFIASASYLTNESYALSGAIDRLSAARSEVDINAGYSVLPGVAVTLGYKQIRQNYGDENFRWLGPTIGAAGSAPLGATNWAVYGLYGFGLMRLAVPHAAEDAFNNVRFNANYSLAEAGLAYAIGIPRVITTLRLTVSYRAQILNTRGYRLFGLVGTTAPNERDFTQGPALGVSGSF